MVHVFCPGENVYIRLYGSCEEVDVHLEPDLVHLTQTYVSLSTVNRTVCLINRHNVPLQYCWTTESSIQEEDLSFMRCVCTNQVNVDNNNSIGGNSEADVITFTIFVDFLQSIVPFARKNSEFQQHEKEKMDESEPMGIHRLSLQGCRSQAVHDLGLSFSHGCITVEPAVGDCTTHCCNIIHYSLVEWFQSHSCLVGWDVGNVWERCVKS